MTDSTLHADMEVREWLSAYGTGLLVQGWSGRLRKDLSCTRSLQLLILSRDDAISENPSLTKYL